MSTTLSPMCRVPGALAGSDCHGTAPSRAQSTLTVEGSSWKERMPRRMRSGTSEACSSSSYSIGATTEATTARRAVKVPSALCTVRARPSVSPMWSTGAEQRISPPSDVNRRARAWVRLPAPPSGTGKPTVWPSMLISSAHQPRPRGVQRDVGVPGVAGEQEARCLAVEAMATEVGRRREQVADELETPGTRQPDQSAERQPSLAGTASAGRRSATGRSGPTARTGPSRRRHHPGAGRRATTRSRRGCGRAAPTTRRGEGGRAPPERVARSARAPRARRTGSSVRQPPAGRRR